MKSQKNDISIFFTEFIHELCQPVPEDGPGAYFVTSSIIGPDDDTYMIISIPQNSAERLLYLTSRMKEVEEAAKNDLVELPKIYMNLFHFHMECMIPYGDLDPLYELKEESIEFSHIPDFIRNMSMEDIDIERIAIDGDGAKIELIYGSSRWAYRIKPDMLKKLAQPPRAVDRDNSPRPC